MFGFKKTVKEIKRPKTTTLEKYHIHFKTVDGEQHLFTRMCAADPNSLTSKNIPNYYMTGENFLLDDDDVKYPINNIISIRFELVEKIDNVIVIMVHEGLGIRKTWYQNKEIKIFEE